MDLDIQLLRTFIALVETGSVTQVAERVGRSQPAVSLQLRRLETLVGQKLIAWEKRKLTLTEEGERLLEYGRRIIDINDRAMAELSSERLHGSISLGAPDIYAAAALPQALRAFRRRFPNIRIELHCALSTILLEMINQEVLDLALVTHAYSGERGEFVCSHPLEWVACVDHEFEAVPPIPLAVLPAGNLLRDVALAALRRHDVDWSIIATSESLGGILAAIYSGIAIGVLPRMVIRENLRVVPPNDVLPQLPVVDLALVGARRATGDAVEALRLHLHETLVAL